MVSELNFFSHVETCANHSYVLFLAVIISFLSDHCSSPDKTPTFTEHVQSRRFKRSADEYSADTKELEFKEMEYKDLYDEEEPAISATGEENEGLIDHPLEQKDLGLAERVEELEQTVASMAGSLRKLEDAFSRLQSQVSICVLQYFSNDHGKAKSIPITTVVNRVMHQATKSK